MIFISLSGIIYSQAELRTLINNLKILLLVQIIIINLMIFIIFLYFLKNLLDLLLFGLCKAIKHLTLSILLS